MRAFINGALLGEDSLANMAWTFEELISFASGGSFVGPADLLASDTHQRGCLTEIWGRADQRVPPPLVPGDVVPPIPPARAASPEAPATEQAPTPADRGVAGRGRFGAVSPAATSCFSQG